MACIPMAYCSVTISIQARMSSFGGQYMTCMQGQSHKGSLRQSCSNLHIYEERILIQQPRAIWFWICANDINCWMKESQKKWVLDWPSFPNTWTMKVGTNLSWEDFFCIGGSSILVSTQEALLAQRWLYHMPNLPIPRAHFCVPLNPNAHPNNKFSKIAQHNL